MRRFLLLLSIVGCASHGGERAAVEAAMRDYAVRLRGSPADSVAAMYAADGELVLPGMGPLHGRASIRDFLAPLAAAVEVAQVDVATDSLTTRGATARQWGTYVQRAGERGKPPQTFRGHYDATWRREGDGRWRLVRLVMQPSAQP